MSVIPRELKLGVLDGHEVWMLNDDHAQFVRFVNKGLAVREIEFDLVAFQDMIDKGQKSLVAGSERRP